MIKAEFFNALLEEKSLQESTFILELASAQISLKSIFDVYDLSKDEPTKIGAITSNSFIAIWDNNLVRTELLKTKYKPHMSSDMQIADCWAYVWRVKAKKDISHLMFACFLDPKQPLLEEGIETGEYLFSKGFSFKNECIHIGTEDEERIYQRANTNDHLPKRYVEEKQIEFENYDNLIESSKLGIQINLPPLKENELVQLQFVIAWGTDPIANWFAVDALTDDILLQAGLGREK